MHDGARVTSINSVMFVLAPLVGTPLLATCRHLPPSDWRIGATFYVSAGAAGAGAFLARRHFRRGAGIRAPLTSRAAQPMHDKILILDFGSQFTQLIARRVARDPRLLRDPSVRRRRRLHREFAPKGIILSGGPESVTEADTPRAPQAVWTRACRCSASATACRRWRRSWAAKVESGARARIRLRRSARARSLGAARGIQDRANPEGHGMLNVWMSHGDKVTAMPPGFKLMASTATCPIAAMADEIAPLLRGAVPPGSHAHDAGRRAARAFRARDLRLRR